MSIRNSKRTEMASSIPPFNPLHSYFYTFKKVTDRVTTSDNVNICIIVK